MLTQEKLCHTGSSPRMRGKQRRRPIPLLYRRLIPAHAGKTIPVQRCCKSARAHPRACGENARDVRDFAAGWGSSPRMRGKHSPYRGRLKPSRLIPAHAGKTFAGVFGGIQSEAHPRACGENLSAVNTRFNSEGSSPRMRGKPALETVPLYARGLIPAHAGKTTKRALQDRSKRAHPRACGENAERSGVLTLRSVRSWKTLSFPSSLKVTHCRTFVQLSLSSIRL